MGESWEEIAERAKDYKFLGTLSYGDKQMLYAFHSFCPAAARLNHLVIGMKKAAVRLLLETIGQPGGVWYEVSKIPFDDTGRCYIEHFWDLGLFPEHFKWWATPKNQEVVYEFAEMRFDERGFAAIFPADTPSEIVRQIDQMDPSRSGDCFDTFVELLPRLGWVVIMLRPLGDFGILLVDEKRRDLVPRVAGRFKAEGMVHFELEKEDDRFYWRGPTTWGSPEGRDSVR